jgi:hypothetical protein
MIRFISKLTASLKSLALLMALFVPIVLADPTLHPTRVPYLPLSALRVDLRGLILA